MVSTQDSSKEAGALFPVAGTGLSNYMQIEIEPFPLVA